ncbi:hypothetical protein [Gluconobacter wancherniae]|uniref:hypothetical protein n=1 Tax=Gluconobacter wancherniae TaxID=1307955 RepID=UPI001B8CC2D2|nr:hypothetical protein [Gluconobacter wancherniae]MBS1089242.1 hypothetical protein [Gluconobacter wancherniae]MBS1094410.1 hypothetical protein [Gluconobacter wancherniae]MBS1094501.1 hypothetical protein [Gluconobacter wancherniae]
MTRIPCLSLLGLLGLTGCGFAPLYAQGGGGQVDVSHELQRIYVQNIPSRYGQEMRLALQKDLGGSAPEQPDGYTLQVGGSAAQEAIDIHGDNTAGRMRISGSAHWRLFTVEQFPKLLAEGDTRVLDGYNATFEQYFAQTLNSESSTGRVAEALAQNMTQQIGVWFRSHIQPGHVAEAALPRFADPDAMPSDHGTVSHQAGADGFPASATGRLNNSTSTTSAADPND